MESTDDWRVAMKIATDFVEKTNNIPFFVERLQLVWSVDVTFSVGVFTPIW